MNAGALAERTDIAGWNTGPRSELEAEGVAFDAVDPAPFKAGRRAARCGEEWEQKFGSTAWSVLAETGGAPA